MSAWTCDIYAGRESPRRMPAPGLVRPDPRNRKDESSQAQNRPTHGEQRRPHSGGEKRASRRSVYHKAACNPGLSLTRGRDVEGVRFCSLCGAPKTRARPPRKPQRPRLPVRSRKTLRSGGGAGSCGGMMTWLQRGRCPAPARALQELPPAQDE